jgi:hypothetical protein
MCSGSLVNPRFTSDPEHINRRRSSPSLEFCLATPPTMSAYERGSIGRSMSSTEWRGASALIYVTTCGWIEGVYGESRAYTIPLNMETAALPILLRCSRINWAYDFTTSCAPLLKTKQRRIPRATDGEYSPVIQNRYHVVLTLEGLDRGSIGDLGIARRSFDIQR